ncbi:MAG: hypothetical protein J4G10_04130 [Alphaproteobacteria bacterium]|nr:hypothetical protein [Alphaproteobacteria bacterium]
MAERAEAKKYQADTARDDISNLNEVLQNIATRKGHVRIVGFTWQPSRPSATGTGTLSAGYTIISEVDA